MDRRFRFVNCHVVRAIRTFWIGSCYRILFDPAGRERQKPERISLRSRIFNTLPRDYRLLRQDFLHRSRDRREEQRQKQDV